MDQMISEVSQSIDRLFYVGVRVPPANDRMYLQLESTRRNRAKERNAVTAMAPQRRSERPAHWRDVGRG